MLKLIKSVLGTLALVLAFSPAVSWANSDSSDQIIVDRGGRGGGEPTCRF